MTATTTTMRPTGPDLIIEAGLLVATRAPKIHMSAYRGLLLALVGESDERRRECLEMAEAYLARRHGPGAWRAIQDTSAAGVLTECGCYWQIQLREAMQ